MYISQFYARNAIFEIFVIISTNSKQRTFKILVIIRFFNVYLLLKQKKSLLEADIMFAKDKSI